MAKSKFNFKISQRTRDIIDKNTDVYKTAGKYRYSDPEKRANILRDWIREVVQIRARFLQSIETGAPEEKYEKRKKILTLWSNREQMIDMMVMFDWTFDPRNASAQLPSIIPFVPWQKQIEYLEWIYDCIFNQEKGCAVKARDQGGSFLALKLFLQEWRWNDGFTAGLGSQKAEKVDKRGDMDALFPKMRFMMQMYPKWWRPEGFDERIHDNFCNLKNPENSNTISGDSGENIGRGGRKSVFLLDEAAFLQFYKKTEAALSRATSTVIELSTPAGPNDFHEKYHSGRVATFCFDWWNDPRVDQEWYDTEKSRTDPVTWAQEVDHDFHASVGGVFIDQIWVNAAVRAKYPPTGICAAGLDVSSKGKNQTILTIRRGPVVKQWEINAKHGGDLTRQVIDICNEAGVDYLNYDEVGVGFAVESAFEGINETGDDVQEIKFNYFGVNAGHKASNRKYSEFRDKYGYEVFADAGSEWCYLTKMRFKKTWLNEHSSVKEKFPEDECICIDDIPAFKNQISAPLEQRTTTGKIKKEPKSSMKTRGIESPDRLDSLTMACIPQDAGHAHVVDATAVSHIYKEINVDPTRIHKTKICHYGAICATDDLKIHCLCAAYDEVHGHLYIYDELYSDQSHASQVIPALASKMNMKKTMVDKLMGNELMFAENKRSLKREYNDALYDQCGRFQYINISEARRYDPMGASAALNELMKLNRITADPRCVELKKAVVGWRVEKGRFKPAGFREALLMIVSELLQIVPLEEIMKMREYLPHIPKVGTKPREKKIGI